MRRYGIIMLLMVAMSSFQAEAKNRVKPQGEAVELPALTFSETGIVPKGYDKDGNGYTMKIEYLLKTEEEGTLMDDNGEDGSTASIAQLMKGKKKKNEKKTTNSTDTKDEKGVATVEVNSSWMIKLKTWADDWIGVPYRYGSMARSGTDCSGFTSLLYKNVFNIALQRSSKAQLTDCYTRVKKADLKMGDLLFFVTNGKSMSTANISHVGVYVGNNIFVHAASKGVTYSSLEEAYYQKTYLTGGRVVNFK